MKYLSLLFLLLLGACRTEEIVPNQLYWYQPRLSKRQFELKKNDQTMATLVWARGSGVRATFQENGQEWCFQQPHWLKSKISIQDLSNGHEIGSFKPRGFLKNGYELSLQGKDYEIFFRSNRVALCDLQGNTIAEIVRADSRRRAVKGVPPNDNLLLAVLRYLQQASDDASSNNANTNL